MAGAESAASAWAALGLRCLVALGNRAQDRRSVEVEWRRTDATLDGPARDRAVGELIGMIAALDADLQARARGRAELLHAYRWQYILAGVQAPHFSALLAGMLDAGQYGRMASALAPLFDSSAVPEVRAAA